MINRVYVLANPVNEGAMLCLNQECNVLSTKQVSTTARDLEYYEAFLDEPVYGGV